MALKLSIFTTVTNPLRRGDNYTEAIACYRQLADELVVVDGNNPAEIHTANYKQISSPWPEKFDWPLIGQQFQKGYEAATGDWVIHADLDFFFHEVDFQTIREAIEKYNGEPALSFYKWQFIIPDRYNLKSRLVVAVNKGMFGNRIRFDSGGDLCQPSLDGKQIMPDDVPEARVPIYNYEKLSKNFSQILLDVYHMDQAYHRHFGKWLYSEDGSQMSAFEGWLKMMEGRFAKPSEHIPLNKHPKFIQETIKNLKPEAWGYDGLGHLERNRYAK